MELKNPMTLDQLITALTKLKNRTSGDLPVVFEGRDTMKIPCDKLKNENIKLAVVVGNDIEVRDGTADSFGRCAWIRGEIVSNGFKRPWEVCEICKKDSEGSDTPVDPVDPYGNCNLNGVVGDSSTNAPPCTC